MIAWEALGGERRAAAPAVGPFPYRPFLEVWWAHRGEGALTIVEHGDSAVAVVTGDGAMSFAGDSDVTDYHAPLGVDPGAAVAAAVASAVPGTRYRFDSMPEEVARPVAAALSEAGGDPVVRPHEATMVLHLDPADPLAGLDRKQRHELRRKARRFEELFGGATISPGGEGFAPFVSMHRMAEGEKGAFMAPGTEAFFRDLLEVPGSKLDLLLTGAGDPVAAAFGFVDAEGYYLYNSAFDPAASAVSPGIVLLKFLIERESASGRRRFDLLKGTETYKRRLGARSRALFEVEGVV